MFLSEPLKFTYQKVGSPLGIQACATLLLSLLVFVTGTVLELQALLSLLFEFLRQSLVFPPQLQTFLAQLLYLLLGFSALRSLPFELFH